MNVLDQRYFGLRPVFQWKYQRSIPSIELGALAAIPGMKAIAMEAAFVLQLPR
jgi:hypothetical protein